MKKKQIEFHSTQREMKFIDEIGTGSIQLENPDYYKKHTRLELLYGYKNGLAKRVRWDNLCKAKIARHLFEAIRKEEAHGHN